MEQATIQPETMSVGQTTIEGQTIEGQAIEGQRPSQGE